MNTIKEVWVDVRGFEGIYQISNHGNLKSFKGKPEGRILSNKNKTGWYFSATLKHNEKFKSVKVHRLIAEHFLDANDTNLVVNHKDGNKQNNHVFNLEWVTPSENVRHAMKLNPQMTKQMNYYNQFVRPKTICQYDLFGNFICEYQNAKLASKFTGVCQRNILQVAGKNEYKPGKVRKQAGGFLWRYKNDCKNIG